MNLSNEQFRWDDPAATGGREAAVRGRGDEDRERATRRGLEGAHGADEGAVRGDAVSEYHQLEEDLGALVSVVNDDVVANMMEEHDKLAAGGERFTRLRVFLFAHADHDGGGTAVSPSVACAQFDSSDEREAERMYVDALNSPIDGRPQFAGDGLDGLAIDGSRIHGAGDQLFSHGGTNAGIPGLFKLHYLIIAPQRGHRHNDKEGPWSPVCCSPGQHTIHETTEFPPSPSSGGYHPEFAETDGRIPE